MVTLGAARSEAQVNATLTDQDRAEIQALSVTYRRALFNCEADVYADLFATPGGYFGSPARGEVRDRLSLMEMVLSYDRCHTTPRPAPTEPRANTTAPALPPPVIEPAPEGAKARIINSRGGGYYDDVYVKTPKGWRFRSRNVVSDEEAAAGLTTQDFIEIRQLAGDDHGHYENLYGAYEDKAHNGPRGINKGPDLFRNSGLRLTLAPKGVRGLAYLRDNGGHYEDLYVKTPQGWRIAERNYVAPEGVAAASDAAARGVVVGTGVFTSFVENMDRSLAFYHDVFGMDVPALPATGERPYNNPNPRLFMFFHIPNAKERHQSARVAGTRVAIELMEVQNVEHKKVSLRLQDPGNATPVLVVRDIDAAMDRLRKANVSMVTPGGKTVTLADGARAVLFRDVDSRIVEILQPAQAPASTAPVASNIVDMRLSISVDDMDRTLRVYRDVLGFTVKQTTPFVADAPTRALTGLARAEVRRASVQAPGSPLAIDFVEFKGVDRSPLQMRIQDRGAARLQVRVQNIDALVDAVKRAGLTIVTDGGGSVPIPPNFKGSLVADPNNFFFTLFEPCDGCAPRDLPPSSK